MTADKGWSAQMDQKIAEIKRDPDAYYTKARKEARRTSTGWVVRSAKKAS